MSTQHQQIDELAALRAEVVALKATQLTAEQREAVDRLTDHVAALEAIVDEHKVRRLFLATVRSWAVGLAAIVAAIWTAKEGLARLLRGLLE